MAALLGSACSAGVVGGTGGGAFGTATAASTTVTTAAGTEDGETAPSDASDASAEASEDGVDATDAASSAAASEGSEGAAAQCGDGVIGGDELCDGDDLDGASCADFGFDDGVLVCDPACSLVTDACFTCGDGEIALNEACDTTNFGGESCMSLGFGGGALLCSEDCQQVIDDGCVPLPSCGDGLLNGGEQCDGNLLGGASCVSQGFDAGQLACTAGCTFDVSECMDDLSGCGMMGDFCIFDENDPQSTCCPAGVGGNVFGICNVFLCV